MDYLILVNKDNLLSKDYIPNNLVKVNSKYTNNQLIYLEKKTLKNAIKLLKDLHNHFQKDYFILSGYRPFLEETFMISDLVRKEGSIISKKYPLPKCSEHQTGLAIDIGLKINNSLMPLNEDSAEIKWLIANSYKYGFIFRYPPNKVEITSYLPNYHHLRYIGSKAYILKKYKILNILLFTCK